MKKKFKLITDGGEEFTVEAEKVDKRAFTLKRWKRIKSRLKGSKHPFMADLVKRTDDAFAKGINPTIDAIGYKVCCPFHGGKIPSLMVRADLGIWLCFSCGKGGKVVHEGDG